MRRENDSGANVQEKIVPALHHGGPPESADVAVSTLGADRLTVWALPPGRTSSGVGYGGQSLREWTEHRSQPFQASQRLVKLTWGPTSGGRCCKRWCGTNDCTPSGTTATERRPACPPFGWCVCVRRCFARKCLNRSLVGTRNILDSSLWVSGYGWPSLEVNNANDIVMSYQRAGENIFYEARYSVYPSAGPDILPSSVLKQANTPGTILRTRTNHRGRQHQKCAAGRLDITGTGLTCSTTTPSGSSRSTRSK